MRYHRLSIKSFFLLLCCGSLAACNKYLDIKPKGYTLLTSVKDYDQWMNNANLWMPPYELNYMTDHTDYPGANINGITDVERMFFWQPQFTETGSMWGRHYSIINSYNSVILGVDEATGGTDRQIRNLKAEALLGRAYEYLHLVNEYGKSYDSATATADLGVPFLTSDDVAQKIPPRSTVKEIYDHIIADINAALPNLPEDNSASRFRGSVSAAYSVLARAYLFAHAYEEARKYAEMALVHSGRTMLDYNPVTNAVTLPPLDIRPDAIYSRLNGMEVFFPAQSYLRSFNTQDKRLRLFYTPLGNLTFPSRYGVYYFNAGSNTSSPAYANYGTSVQEMKLIIAEAAARSHDLAEALKQLDEVRKNRIIAASYVPYDSDDAAFVLQKILEERAFEFPFHALRWFDMKRLAAENRVPAFTRLDADNNVVATLAPNSPRYTLQIPSMVLLYNQDMPQND